MTCNDIRQSLSAHLDGEPAVLDAAVVDTHVARCPSCREFRDRATELRRVTRLAPAPDMPDLAPAVLAAAASAAPDHDDTERALRWVLVAIGMVQIAFALPALVLGSDAHLPVHVARHIGSFDVALAVGFLFAAWRPARIPGLLPVVAALVVCLIGSSILDVAAGNTAALSEAQHATDIAGLVVVWLLSRWAPRTAFAT